MLNGVTELIMMKADVLDGFDTIYACTHYEYNGETIDYMPYDIISIKPTPVLKAVEGWKTDITKITKVAEIPTALSNYIAFLEAELNVPVKFLSVGPDRVQTLTL